MVRVIWRVAWLVLLLISGLTILFSIYPWMPLHIRAKIRALWSRLLLGICGIELQSIREFTRPINGPMMVVMNHVSWLDIFVLTAVFPATFIAKSEIRRWPLLGWLVAGSGTIFIERGSRHAVRHVNQEISRRLLRGEHVAFFPEGTTSDGRTVLAFHTSLFAAAMPGHMPAVPNVAVLPVALTYVQSNRRSEAVPYIGEQTLLGSIHRILSARGLLAQLHLLNPISVCSAETTRHALAAKTRDRINHVVQSRWAVFEN